MPCRKCKVYNDITMLATSGYKNPTGFCANRFYPYQQLDEPLHMFGVKNCNVISLLSKLPPKITPPIK